MLQKLDQEGRTQKLMEGGMIILCQKTQYYISEILKRGAGNMCVCFVRK